MLRDFEYRVVTQEGRTVTGVEAGHSEEEIVDALRLKGHAVVDVKAREQEQPVAAPATKQSMELFGVSPQTVVFFTRQFATTLMAGVPLLQAMRTLRDQASSPTMKTVVNDVMNRIQQGESLADSMGHHEKIFPPLFLSMIRVGEACGSLDETSARLADILERDLELRQKIRGALAYPVFVLAFSLILVYGMVVFLLPAFTPIFQSSGLNIPRDYPLTHALMVGSKLASSPFFVGAMIIVMVGAIAGLRAAARTRKGRDALDSLKLSIPIFGRLVRTAILTQFCRTFSTLTSAGVPLLEALGLVATTSGNVHVERSILKASREIQSGDRISKTLARVEFFPPLILQMATIGEQTGTLDSMFARVADYYDRELDASIRAVTGLIEPVMMVVVGGIVCTFVMAVLLPVLGISSAFQSQL